MINDLNTNVYNNQIKTELKKFEAFYPADQKHLNYYNNNPNAGYCRVVIAPKVNKVKEYIQIQNL